MSGVVAKSIVHRMPNCTTDVAAGCASRCCSSVDSQSATQVIRPFEMRLFILMFVIFVSANFDTDVLFLIAHGVSISLRVFCFCCVPYNQLAFLLLLPSSGCMSYVTGL